MPLLSDSTVAILVENGAEQNHVTEVRELLEQAGITVIIISPEEEEVKVFGEGKWENRIKIDLNLNQFDFEECNALIIPGGALHIDKLRPKSQATDLVKQFFNSGKIVAALGHGVQLLISAEITKDMKMTGTPSIKQDVINAGAQWSDDNMVTDNGLLTSNGNNVNSFCKKLMKEIKEGVHQRTETII
jgi:protease I